MSFLLTIKGSACLTEAPRSSGEHWSKQGPGSGSLCRGVLPDTSAVTSMFYSCRAYNGIQKPRSKSALAEIFNMIPTFITPLHLARQNQKAQREKNYPPLRLSHAELLRARVSKRSLLETDRRTDRTDGRRDGRTDGVTARGGEEHVRNTAAKEDIAHASIILRFVTRGPGNVVSHFPALQRCPRLVGVDI